MTGAILRSGKGRIVSLVSDSTGQIIACHGWENAIELFYLCEDEEAEKRLKKRRKKERRKAEK